MTKSKLDQSKSRAPFFLKLVTPQLGVGKIRRLSPAKKNVFVLSTGRTATVYLSSLLNQVNGVLSVHEPKPSRILNAWTTARLEGRVSDDFMAATLAGKRRRLAGIDKDIYVESNNFIAGFADALELVFANVSVVHLVRDPRDFITSLTNRGDNEGIRLLFNKHVPYWAYVPAGKTKRKLTALTRAAYRWVVINEYLKDWGRRHPDRYHFFRFEDIMDKNHPDKINPVLAAIGLSKAQIAKINYSPEPIYQKARFSLIDRPIDANNTSSRQAMAKWTEWGDADKRTVEQICGPLMHKYGYGGEAAWKKAIR